VLAPLAWIVEGVPVIWSWRLAAAIVFLVVGASLLGVNALHTLMRRGQAARVASLIYFTPVFAVALEFAMFGIVPSVMSVAGIAVSLLGVALVAWQARPPRPPGDRPGTRLAPSRERGSQWVRT
jgi:drug/metabolite transporter (DMT)-like permease